MPYRAKLLAGAAGAMLWTAGSTAYGQQSGPSSEGSGAPTAREATIAEVVVQARRRDENIQDVPLSVTALSAQALENASIADVQDLTRSVPNLTVSPSTGRRDTATFGIRSQRNIQDGIDADPSVGVYFADMYVARPYGINQTFYDMQSVQVLKGPQGTLFGRNTTGGAVLFQPARPSLGRVEGYVEGQVSNYDGRLASGAINLPLGESLAFRLSGQIEKRDGFTDNLFDGGELDNLDYSALRGSVLFEPNAKFSNYLVVDYYDSSDAGSSNFIVAARPGGLASFFYPDIQAEIDAQRARGVHTVNLNGPAFSETETTTVVNNTTIRLGDITLKNILGWRRVDLNGAVDLDGSPFTILHLAFRPNAEQWSNEFQVQGEAMGGALEWITGLYYFTENGDDLSAVDFFGLFSSNSGGDAKNTSSSVFAQGAYTFTSMPELTLNAGLRYTWDRRSVNVRPRFDGACAFVDASGAALCSFRAKEKWDAPTWTLGLDYRVNEDTLLYISHRRGYRSGGFNLNSRSEAELLPAYDPETITDVEVGAKSDWSLGGMPVRTNIALYYGKGKDLQRTVFAGTAGTLRVINAASADFYGVELEGQIRPTEGLTVSAFYSYDRGKYDKFTFEDPTNPGVFLDVVDSAFPSAPKNKFGLAVRYEMPLSGGLGELAFGANYFWQDSLFFDALSALEPESRIGAYDTLNLRVEWNDIAGKGVDAAIFARNVLDEEYSAGGTGSQSDFGFDQNQAGEPRIVGLQLRYRFGR